MARERHEAHALQQVAEGLRLAGGVFDEFDAVHSQRIGRLGQALSARHTDSILRDAMMQGVLIGC